MEHPLYILEFFLVSRIVHTFMNEWMRDANKQRNRHVSSFKMKEQTNYSERNAASLICRLCQSMYAHSTSVEHVET